MEEQCHLSPVHQGVGGEGGGRRTQGDTQTCQLVDRVLGCLRQAIDVLETLVDHPTGVDPGQENGPVEEQRHLPAGDGRVRREGVRPRAEGYAVVGQAVDSGLGSQAERVEKPGRLGGGAGTGGGRRPMICHSVGGERRGRAEGRPRNGQRHGQEHHNRSPAGQVRHPCCCLAPQLHPLILGIRAPSLADAPRLPARLPSRQG